MYVNKSKYVCKLNSVCKFQLRINNSNIKSSSEHFYFSEIFLLNVNIPQNCDYFLVFYVIKSFAVIYKAQA